MIVKINFFCENGKIRKQKEQKKCCIKKTAGAADNNNKVITFFRSEPGNIARGLSTSRDSYYCIYCLSMLKTYQRITKLFEFSRDTKQGRVEDKK